MKCIIENFKEIQSEQNVFSNKITIYRTRALFFLIINGVTLHAHIYVGDDGKNIQTIEFSTVVYGEDTRIIKKLYFQSDDSENFKVELRKFFKRIKFSNLYGDKEEFWFESMKRNNCLKNIKYSEAKLKNKINEIFNVKTTQGRESALLSRVIEKINDDIVIYEGKKIMAKIKLTEIY